MALKTWNSNFHFRIVRPEKQGLTFSDVPLLPEIFRWNDTKNRVPFTFQQNFPETFCKCLTANVCVVEFNRESQDKQ